MGVSWDINAKGKVTLDGAWTPESIAALSPVLSAWEYRNDDGEVYGLWECGKFSNPNQIANFSMEFGSDNGTVSSYEQGWLTVGECIYSFDGWTRNWIENPPDIKSDKVCKLTTAQYNLLLQLMHTSNLAINILYEQHQYDDSGGGEGKTIHSHKLTSDGNELICTDVPLDWEDYGKAVFDGAVKFFMEFVEDTKESAIQKWVAENVAPSYAFTRQNDDECEDEDIENAEYEFDYDIFMYSAPFDESSVIKFKKEFSPNTEKWDDFIETMQNEYGWFENDL